MSKTAILVISFGTTYPETRKKTIKATEQAIANKFPDADVFEAFTSNVVLKRIEKNEGIKIDTPSEAIEKIRSLGYQQLFVQSLHIIPGHEYHLVVKLLSPYAKDFEKFVIGKPLLTSLVDYRDVKNYLVGMNDLADDEAVLFMGHGTATDIAFTAYGCLDHMLMGTRNYLGTVESWPDLKMEMARMKSDGIKKVHLFPFMLVAGNHANKDMASDDKNSWNSQLQKAGFETTPHLVGLGESEFIQNQFVKHLRAAIRSAVNE
ncbi:sirohydrochlorin cobaltochelatase [Companilactobacillus sp.]|jgi:sirohydrochlorin cobaltochelatase|uniref:sirohydrochlorin cobaltochelatase n=1 Tax=Companilactobacillus sp. TaxID=2767905 RepID=UPI0025BE6E07|nr:sirohydrochlorin cobaltochelatase [Companilactobacillus sp.]MCH4008619.1 sirohydrochlorin cobaltochelatase [Companilactobacillus sp.]MCH4051202.1 sirohydrochlorin cobaltochelatase [Companilactobacillus sp.]MCH4076562.1 sirohydrochlorin cobaltochelatase [Companilactobacillus sp.]MCH4125137.1 sirohydrochlorin cobaltochelatase [Companilactobacillus sp.]MCH4131677.1 sirohydrochlorin cobaltochelatase [Companilactobacillus sp.]